MPEQNESSEETIIQKKQEDAPLKKTDTKIIQTKQPPVKTRKPMSLKKALQHSDTPQIVLIKLKKITNQQKTSAIHIWTQICDYLTQQRTTVFVKGRTRESVYNELRAHYQDAAKHANSVLKKTYADIIEIITHAYENSSRNNRH